MNDPLGATPTATTQAVATLLFVDDEANVLSSLKRWQAIGAHSGRCWRPSAPSSSGTAGRGWGPRNAVVFQLMT